MRGGAGAPALATRSQDLGARRVFAASPLIYSTRVTDRRGHGDKDIEAILGGDRRRLLGETWV